MRLNKYLANCGVGSRRKCDEFIKSGAVLVDGCVASLGQEVLGTECITINGKVVEQAEKMWYFMLNKPKGCVTTVHDDRGRTTVLDIFAKAYKNRFGAYKQVPRVVPVGRLDYNTQGLLLLTNDGNFANALMHPSKKVAKKYVALIYPHLDDADINALKSGIVIDGIKTLPADIRVLQNVGTKQRVEITITQGRNRQVRKMFEAVNKKVNQLERVAIGNLQLGNLARGDIKELDYAECKLALFANL